MPSYRNVPRGGIIRVLSNDIISSSFHSCDLPIDASVRPVPHYHRKMLQTSIPGTIIKFIANYMKGHKAYTTYRNHTSSRKFKTGVPQGGVLSPTLFNIYTADIPPPRALVQVMAYADDTMSHHIFRKLHASNWSDGQR